MHGSYLRKSLVGNNKRRLAALPRGLACSPNVPSIFPNSIRIERRDQTQLGRSELTEPNRPTLDCLHSQAKSCPTFGGSLSSSSWLATKIFRLRPFSSPFYNDFSTANGNSLTQSIHVRPFSTASRKRKPKKKGTPRYDSHRDFKDAKQQESKSKKKGNRRKDIQKYYQYKVEEETRPILSDKLFQQIRTSPRLEALGLNADYHILAKSLVHNALEKLEFLSRYELDTIHNSEFLTTLTLTFPRAGDLFSYLQTQGNVEWDKLLQNRNPKIICTMNEYFDGEDGKMSKATNPNHIQLELVGLGSAASKKQSERMAATDIVLLFKEELGMDLSKDKAVPNFKALRKEAADKQQRLLEEEAEAERERLYKANLSRAQMILELVNSSRPNFSSLEKLPSKRRKHEAWIATASVFLRGRLVNVIGEPGRNKAEAEGQAIIALANSLDVQEMIGPDVLEMYQRIMEASPGQHIAALRVPALPDDVLYDLEKSIGTAEDQAKRAEQHASAKNEYEANINERKNKKERSGTSKRSLSPRQAEAINATLKLEEEKRMLKAIKNPDGKAAAMKAIRDALPIKKIQQDLITALDTKQVIVVSGGTGSGKSTQCPQYILEDVIAKGKGAETKILVTQPRKIAAVSVSDRVAAERGEAIGNSVGYTVRFQRKAPRDHGGSIEFVTTGVLLRRLINDPTLADISHVMIDEVHERDINTDFLLVLLRDLLKERPDLRVILMSATLDAESFGHYFSRSNINGVSENVPVLSVPTQPRHPVEVFYLEDMTGDGKFYPRALSSLAESLLQYNDEQLKSDLEEAMEEEEAADRLQKLSQREDEGDAFDSDYDSSSDSESDSDDDEISVASTTPRARRKHKIETLRRALSLRKPEEGQTTFSPAPKVAKNFDNKAAIVQLVVKVAEHLCEEEINADRDGSILCFLPGWEEIKSATAQFETIDHRLKNKIKVLPLHSTIPHDDQRKVFEPANGKIKVILATNIAESSVTIDDVLAIVDCGLVREMNFDPESALTSMETNKTSRASATQRLGRAGRVAPGKCYRLYSRGDFETMPPRPTPEIQRTALEATCLQTCSMQSKGVATFLQQALDPPPEDSVSVAMERLVQLGAIKMNENGETLTPLGRCLSRLPLDPATGRMLIMGVVMKCLDPLLTTAASFSSRNVFYNPPGLRDEALEIRKSFSDRSDIMATTKAYEEFWMIVDTKGWDEAKAWAYDRYISISAMASIKAVRSQLLEELIKIGMVPSSDLERSGNRQRSLKSDGDVNQNAGNEKLYSAIWATAFPGNLASRRQLGNFGTLRTRLDQHAGLHPSSVTFHRKPPTNWRDLPSWYLYREMVLSSQVFLRDTTGMEPEQLMLFGGYNFDSWIENNASQRSRSRIGGVLDDWIVVEGPCQGTLDALAAARQEINLALERKVIFPKAALPKETQEILDSVEVLLAPADQEEEFDY